MLGRRHRSGRGARFGRSSRGPTSLPLPWRRSRSRAPGIADVRAWGADQLLAGARAMLSFPPLQATVDGVEQPPDPDEMVAMPDPLTYGSLREAITAVPKRRGERLPGKA